VGELYGIVSMFIGATRWMLLVAGANPSVAESARARARVRTMVSVCADGGG
jgi:hypothetical protein